MNQLAVNPVAAEIEPVPHTEPEEEELDMVTPIPEPGTEIWNASVQSVKCHDRTVGVRNEVCDS